MERFPVIITIGAALIGYVAGDMAISDLAIKDWVDAHVTVINVPIVNKHLHEFVAAIAGAGIVLGAGKLLAMRKTGAGGAAESKSEA
jgi:predicted tellurium resistance membrane protein TerC